MTAILARLAHAGAPAPAPPLACRRQVASGRFCASRARPPYRGDCALRPRRLPVARACHSVPCARSFDARLSRRAESGRVRLQSRPYLRAGAAACACRLCVRLDCRLGACADLDRSHRFRPHARLRLEACAAASATRISAESVASEATANAHPRHRNRPGPDQGKPDRRPGTWARASRRAALRRDMVGLAADQRLRHRASRRCHPRRHGRVGRCSSACRAGIPIFASASSSRSSRSRKPALNSRRWASAQPTSSASC